MSSNELCKACSLLEGLERGMPQAAIVSVAHFIEVYMAELRDRLIVGERSSLQRARHPRIYGPFHSSTGLHIQRLSRFPLSHDLAHHSCII